MNKNLNLTLANKAVEVLTKIKQTVDRDAFIAGALPASLYLGKDWTTDIDLFFSSPNFEFDALGNSAFYQLKAVFPDLQHCDQDVYWYNKRFARIGRYNNIDFIQVNKKPEGFIAGVDYVLEKFDINMCKIAMGGSSDTWRSEVKLYPGSEFLQGLSGKILEYDTNLCDYSYENEAQAKVTEKRLEKYKSRFADYKVVKK